MIHWGANDWYIAPRPSGNGVLKVRHGIVWEVGIADKQLTSTRAAQRAARRAALAIAVTLTPVRARLQRTPLADCLGSHWGALPILGQALESGASESLKVARLQGIHREATIGIEPV